MARRNKIIRTIRLLARCKISVVLKSKINFACMLSKISILVFFIISTSKRVNQAWIKNDFQPRLAQGCINTRKRETEQQFWGPKGRNKNRRQPQNISHLLKLEQSKHQANLYETSKLKAQSTNNTRNLNIQAYTKIHPSIHAIRICKKKYLENTTVYTTQLYQTRPTWKSRWDRRQRSREACMYACLAPCTPPTASNHAAGWAT